MAQGKVEICGVNTAKLPILKEATFKLNVLKKVSVSLVFAKKYLQYYSSSLLIIDMSLSQHFQL